MNIRLSTEHQQYACRIIAEYTGIPLPLGWASDFYVCHAYIGRYYNNAKYIRATCPNERGTQMGMVDEERANERLERLQRNQPYNPQNYSRLHEAIANATADPIRQDGSAPPFESQRRAVMFIREQLGIIPPPDVIRYCSAATAFIQEHYAHARARFDMRRQEGAPPDSITPEQAEMIRRMNILDNPAVVRTFTRDQLDQLLNNGPEPMPAGFSYENPSPSHPDHVVFRGWPDAVRTWRNNTAQGPRPITEGDLISPTRMSLDYGGPDDPIIDDDPYTSPSEEELKDLIARQFNAR
jgi:hypothetical protein